MGTPPFGHYALSPWREKLRLLAGGSRHGLLSRLFTSLSRRCSLVAHPDPFDLEIFKGQRARLYPRTNLCEKRVYARPDSWDHKERQKISQIVCAHEGEQKLVFVDAGANVGLYSLFVLGEAQAANCPLTILAIEPDPTNRQRLNFNIAASGAQDSVKIVDKALGANEERGALVFRGDNRGEIRLATIDELAIGEEEGSGENVTVDIVPLNSLFVDENMAYVDILKIDIEGGEADVFKAFFKQAERTLFPRWIILETISTTGEAALQACLSAGYEVDLQTRMNAVLKLQTKQDD